MSRFSGKCDLYDHIMMEYRQTKDTIQDELRCFDAFKAKTHGVIHQHRKVKVTKWNRDFVKEHCNVFDYIDEEYEVSDKRCKNGVSKRVRSTYTYWGKEYTLDELNEKEEVYITIDIPFDTILDIIPYYPYIISVAACHEDSEYIVLSNESFVDSNYLEKLSYGLPETYPSWYKGELQKHYIDVCKELAEVSK